MISIPPLDRRGLLPAGRHETTLDNIRRVFCHNAYRENLWLQFEMFIEEVREDKPSLAYPMALSGSFFTDKARPQDIDCAILLPENISSTLGWNLVLWLKSARDRIKQEYAVDLWVSLPGATDFQSFWEYVGPKTAEAKNLNPKDLRGILVVSKW